ncbi:MAG: pyridoxamine 5'-phosphate oxidase family protein [Actinomycetota bacterium]|nr:pyridoxamine 5'-phosphate oxidase family protein [Actinomycetota bacterium]
MADVLDGIDDKLAEWLQEQPVFFVATAPLAADGLVNCSPKGLAGTFAVIDERTVAYLDLTGSGIETIAHLRENGRIVLMFCAFDGRPNIVRMHGRGRVVLPTDEAFEELAARFTEHPGARSVVVVHVERLSESCGYAVPTMDYRADRDVLDLSNRKRGEDGLAEYRREKNTRSLDGLPGLA